MSKFQTASRPTHIRITSREEGMPFGQVFPVIGWTGFDQAVVRDENEDVLIVLQPTDFEPEQPVARIIGSIYRSK